MCTLSLKMTTYNHKMTTYNHKMNANITLDSTIAGLVNGHSPQTTREEGRICWLKSKFCIKYHPLTIHILFGINKCCFLRTKY